MTNPPNYNLVIIQPTGYIHSLGFIDQARYFRHHLNRLNRKTSITKNRFEQNSINIIFGAHLGFDIALTEKYRCIFVNLEQLGNGGSQQSSAYLDLLKNSAVIDYDEDNQSTYCSLSKKGPILTFGSAPYLKKPQIELEKRPIDLLFFGSINERRKEIIHRIESTGTQVSFFDHPIYGQERDAYIVQSKCVLNCPYYDSNRFEQVRVSQCLSLGTPVISERGPNAKPNPIFESSVEWFDNNSLEKIFRDEFLNEKWFNAARSRLLNFQNADCHNDFIKITEFCENHQGTKLITQAPDVETPKKINLGSGKDYKPGWLNIDITANAKPDLILDLSKNHEFPITATDINNNKVTLEKGQITHIYANNVLEHVPNLTLLMTNCLELLTLNGLFEIEVPYEKSVTAWQDPTHLRAMNENSWIYYTDWFWYLGWFKYRFLVKTFNWLDSNLQPCQKQQASFMQVVLSKTETSPYERTLARTMQADFSGIPCDT
jgi:hypothetical protein